MKRILFVCLGNICRSPLAEGILRNKGVENNLDIIVDSCGTEAYHQGESPHPRSIAIAKKNGIDISMLKARKFALTDFDSFDHIFVMDKSNYADVLNLASSSANHRKVELILNLLETTKNQNVPDPYYGGESGFVEVYDLLDASCDAIINKLKNAL